MTAHGLKKLQCSFQCYCGWKTKTYFHIEEAAAELRRHMVSRRQSMSHIARYDRKRKAVVMQPIPEFTVKEPHERRTRST